jgi:hypothetical protein
MDTLELAGTLADPIGTVGMSFYLSPQAIARGEGLELDVVTFYAGGRGGVLGDIEAVEAVEVDRIFYFFKTGLVASMVERARVGAGRQETVATHLEVANDYAEATFGGISLDTLQAFSAAASALADTLPRGRWPLVDGYRALRVPGDPVHRAYYWSIVLRELRGGVHTEAVIAAGMSGAEACQLDHAGSYFALHGYSDEDRAEETEELVATRLAVEMETSSCMAALLEVLDGAQRAALAHGAIALHEAVDSPLAAA